MQIIADFMNAVPWYRPTTDTDDWASFLASIQQGAQPPSTVGQVVQMAGAVTAIQPGEDVGMWTDLIRQFQSFVNEYKGEDPASPLTDTGQYDYVRCFLNAYWNAAHNAGLWQAMNDTAQRLLNQQPNRTS